MLINGLAHGDYTVAAGVRPLALLKNSSRGSENMCTLDRQDSWNFMKSRRNNKVGGFEIKMVQFSCGFRIIDAPSNIELGTIDIGNIGLDLYQQNYVF